MAKQITVRGVTRDLSARLERLSKTRGQSLNSTVLEILKGAVGIDERRERLQRYATWTAQDLEEFEEALKSQRVVDEHLWR